MVKEICYKFHSKIHRMLVLSQRNKKHYFYLYKSYWHSVFKKKPNDTNDKYISARPNPGAGIGHQISNWISGYNLAKIWNIKYAYFPFSSVKTPFVANEWDEMLGFSSDEVGVDYLTNIGYKKILLPMFDEKNDDEVKLIKRIISSYSKKVIFILEQDQKILNDTLSMDILKAKYWKKNKSSVLYSDNNINVAIHIRRGDIVQTGKKKNDNLTMRWLDDMYYINLVDDLMNVLKDYNFKLFLFSQGEKSDFRQFLKYKNIKFCLDVSDIDTFISLTNADILIMSRSGFSYQAAKLNCKGILIYPYDFWHNVFDDNRTIIPKKSGNIEKKLIEKMVKNRYENKCKITSGTSEV